MFKNAGAKIKIISYFMFAISVIGGLKLSYDFAKDSPKWLLFVPAIIVASWFVNLLFYAFGELCENIYDIKIMMKHDASQRYGEDVINEMVVEHDEIKKMKEKFAHLNDDDEEDDDDDYEDDDEDEEEEDDDE